MDRLIQVTGALLVLAVLQDVFFTVLFPGSGRGLLRRPLARATWAVVRAIGRRIGDRDRRRRFLGYSGPVQITVNLTAWILVLITGWALIFQPALGTRIVASSGHTDTGWATAFYYSGYTLTTLGFGDVVATTGLYRLLTVLEAVIGFATVSMAITYFLSVYSALTQRKVTAARLHHRTYDTGDAAALLAGMSRDGEIPGAPDEFGELAEFFQRVLETHAAYPVLRYFRSREPWSTLPRVLLVALDGVTLVHSVLDPAKNHDLLRSPSVWSLRVAAEQLLDELLPEAQASRNRLVSADPEEETNWRARFRCAAERLDEQRMRLRPDLSAAADDYVALRARWNGPLRAVAAAMLDDWSEVDPTGAGR